MQIIILFLTLLHILDYKGKIAITNPKRIPSLENAKYAAKTLDVKLGTHVGVKYKKSKGEYYNKRLSKLT